MGRYLAPLNCIVDHIGIRIIGDLEEAEAYYSALFELAVGFREAPTLDGWATLCEGATWDDARRANIDLRLTFLVGERLSLAIERTDEVGDATDGTDITAGVLSHICLRVVEGDLGGLRRRVEALNERIIIAHPTYLIFDDRFGVRWEITAAKPRSNGDGNGRWLPIA